MAYILPPDIRVRSVGAAGAYGFQPMTRVGKDFVENFAATIEGGRWHEGVFWFPDKAASPYEVLRGCGLMVVSGVGDDPFHDRPWPELAP